MELTRDEIKSMLDVATLRPTTTEAEVEDLARTVVEERYGYLCVNSLYVERAAPLLKGSSSKVAGCVGFPHSTIKTEHKVAETEQSVADGADEVDMVLNLGWFLGGDTAAAEDDVRAVVKAAAGRPVKVIIETPFLTHSQKVDASKLVQNCGGAFVKTCTGTSPDPIALYEDIRLIRQTIGPDMGIKASGRVGNYFRLMSMVEAGATRVGLIIGQAREIVRGYDEAIGT